MAPHCRLHQRIVANNQLFANPRISHITDLRRETPIELRAWLRVLKTIARSLDEQTSERAIFAKLQYCSLVKISKYFLNPNLARSLVCSSSEQSFSDQSILARNPTPPPAQGGWVRNCLKVTDWFSGWTPPPEVSATKRK